MGQILDIEVNAIIPVLLKRAGDTNAFLSTTAGETLRTVVHCATSARVLTALLPCCATRHVAMRSKAASFAGVSQRIDLFAIPPPGPKLHP